jgi:Glycosyl hydrolases family 15
MRIKEPRAFPGEIFNDFSRARVGDARCAAKCQFGRAAPPIDPTEALETTARFWRKWCSRCPDTGPWTDAVKRSLITLKALTYAPTGEIVAAVTTSLPERLGGSRNWDYRFCWLRDATFTLLAFMHLGYYDEARTWRDWLRPYSARSSRTLAARQPVRHVSRKESLRSLSAAHAPRRARGQTVQPSFLARRCHGRAQSAQRGALASPPFCVAI